MFTGHAPLFGTMTPSGSAVVTDEPGGHDHGASDGSTRRLGLVALINLVGFVGELAGGLLFGSVALLSDALHMLFDGLAYLMAFGASYTAARFEYGGRYSYGLHRLEPAAAFLNGVLLVPMVGYIVWESYQRFLAPTVIDHQLTLVIAAGGLAINLVSVWVVHGDDMSLNERGAYYHLLGDAGGSVAVIVATLAVWLADLPVADPIAAVLIAVLILVTAGRVLRESTGILLQRSPVALDAVREDLLAIEGVERVDDLHVWQVCSKLTVGTVHVVDDADTLAERVAVRRRVHDLLAARGVDHVTVESVGVDEADDGRRDHSH